MLAETRRTPVVQRGRIIALRFHDIAYEIDLARAEALWTQHAAGRAARRGLLATPAKAMAYEVPPLNIDLGPVSVELDGITLQATVTARLYDFGALTLAIALPVADLSWADFTRRVNQMARVLAGEAVWRERLAMVRQVVAGALIRPGDASLVEDYLIAEVNQLDTRLDAAALLERVDLVELLSGETRPLSMAARNDLLRRQFSYYVDDLVVLTWDRAFLYEPRGDSDVADVLEVANVQLLEMRYYDELLDDELPRMNDLVASARKGLNILAARRYAGLARRLYTLVADVTELTEKVDNALQVTEDVYLSRVYASALEQFRVGLVSAAVDRKLAIVRETYTALYDEASGARATLIEIAVLVLILVEVVMALVCY